MGRRFTRRGIEVFFLCLLVIFGLNRLIKPDNLSKIERLEGKLKRDSNNASVILQLADSYYKKAIHLSSSVESYPYLEGAISLYKRAYAIDKDPKTAFYLGRAYFTIAKYSKEKEGVEFYKNALKNFLFAYEKGLVDKELFILIAHSYLISGSLDKAIEFYKKAILLSKKDPIILLNLAFCYKEKEEFDEALKYLKMIDEPQERELSINLHLEIGDIYEKKGLLFLARKEYLLVLEKDKRNKTAIDALKRLE